MKDEPKLRKARARADNFNRGIMLRHLRRHKGNAKKLVEFIDFFENAIEAHHEKAGLPPLADGLQAAIAKCNAPETRSEGLQQLYALGANFIEKSRFSFAKIPADTAPLGFRLTTPEEQLEKAEKRTAMRAEAAQAGIRAAQAIGELIVLSGKLPIKAGAAPIVAIANLYEATCKLLGIGFITRHVILAAKTLLAIMLQFTQVDAAPYKDIFLHGKADVQALHDVCRLYPRLLEGSGYNAAFARSVDLTKPHRASMLWFALGAMEAGMSPSAVMAVLEKESIGGQNVTGRIASGLPQYTVATVLEAIAKHAAKTSSYKAAKKRLASAADYPTRAADAAFIHAIDATIKEFNKDSRGLVRKVRDRITAPHVFEAMNLAYSTDFGGQLFGYFMKERAPFLTSENFEAASLTQKLDLIGRYYTMHLPGPAGGAYVAYLAENHGNVMMNDAAALSRLYATFPKADSSFAPHVGNYYKAVIASNPGVFKNGDNITATQFTESIARFVEQWSKPLLERIERQYGTGPDALSQCLKNQDAFASLVPKTTTPFEVGLLKIAITFDENAPDWMKSASSEAMQLARAYIRQITDTGPRAPGSIEELINIHEAQRKSGPKSGPL